MNGHIRRRLRTVAIGLVLGAVISAVFLLAYRSRHGERAVPGALAQTPAAQLAPPAAKPQSPPEMALAGRDCNGLRVELSCDTPATTADRQPLFKVTLRNVSGRRLCVPDFSAFTAQEHPWVKSYIGQPLIPVIECVSGRPSSYTMGGYAEIGMTGARAISIEDGESVEAAGLPLKREGYAPGREDYGGKTTGTRHVLFPDSTYRVAFCFANEQRHIGDQEIWTGKAVSNPVEVAVKPVPTAHLRVVGGFEIAKSAFFIGEPIHVTFKVVNKGDAPFSLPTGGDYGMAGRHERFSFTAVDESGTGVRDPAEDDPRWRPGILGGLGCDEALKPGDVHEETLLLNQWCAFDRPGRFTVTCRRTLGGGTEHPGDVTLPAIAVVTTLSLTIFRDRKSLAQQIADLDKRLSSPNWGAAVAEMKYLAQMRCDEAFPVISRLATKPGGVQSTALGWLTLYGEERAAPVLRSVMASGGAAGRMAALHLLADRQSSDLGPAVKAALRSPDPAERRQAVLLCSKNKYPECLDALLAMGDDPDLIVRRYLGAALGTYGDTRAVPVLLRLLHDRDPDHFIKIWAAGGLGGLGRKEGIPVMIDLLRAPETVTYRGNIAMTLEQLTGMKVKYKDDYETWRDWWEKEGRAKFLPAE